tara:strand:+ start:7644 stop:8069 length:426 start_codon:yes stop_codon:yes gene_type:complete
MAMYLGTLEKEYSMNQTNDIIDAPLPKIGVGISRTDNPNAIKFKFLVEFGRGASPMKIEKLATSTEEAKLFISNSHPTATKIVAIEESMTIENQIVQDYESGESLQKLAAKYKKCRRTLKDILLRRNIKIRKATYYQNLPV